jgi:ferredoxin-NADP reductase
VAGTALQRRLNWLAATVVEKRDETPRVRSIVFECPGWGSHRAGQHVDIRLTAEDGYQAQRSYSIASSPEDDHLWLTVERLQDGEVSPYLFDDLRPGDQLEMRGPIGGFFTWDTAVGGPLLLVAGGSGIVPFRSMLRHRVAAGSRVPVRLLYSARTFDDLVYNEELTEAAEQQGVDVRIALTRERPEGWAGYERRVDLGIMRDVAWAPAEAPHVFVCGPNGFVEAAASALVELGHDPFSIKTERFGPTGT